MKHYFVDYFPKHVLTLFLIIVAYASILTIFNGSDNPSMLRVFSDDEASQVDRFQEMLENSTLDAGGFRGGFYHYGQAYNAVTYGLINVLELLGFDRGDYSLSVLMFKLISLTGYIVSVILVYFVLRDLGVSESISVAFSLIFGVHADYWGWATTIHPDTLQMSLMLLSFWVIIKIKSFNMAVVVSSFIIGLSFGAKYSGVFLTIFIAILIILHAVNKGYGRWRADNINYFINISSWSALSFFAGWIALNPHVIFRFNKLLEDLAFQKQNLTSGGGGKILDEQWFQWISMYRDEYGVVSIFIIMGLMYLFICAATFLIKEKPNDWLISLLKDRKKVSLVAIFVYIFISALYLIVSIKYREWRYSYHIFPFVIIMSGYGLHLLMRKIDGKNANIIIFVVGLLFVTPKAFSNFELLADTHYLESRSPYVKAGVWLRNKYSPENVVLAGTYSYVDKQYFKNIAYTYDVNQRSIQKYRPDVIFMNDSVPGRYVWKKKGSLMSEHDFTYKTSWKDQSMVNEYGVFLKNITSEGSGWAIVYESDEVVILERER